MKFLPLVLLLILAACASGIHLPTDFTCQVGRYLPIL